MQRIDQRKSALRYGWLAAIVLLLVVAPAFGAPATEATDASQAPASSASSAQTSVGAASSYTWQLLSHEYCLDRFGTTCPNGATSADPCPVADPQGKPCSIPFDRCWSVLSAWWADEYRCQ